MGGFKSAQGLGRPSGGRFKSAQGLGRPSGGGFKSAQGLGRPSGGGFKSDQGLGSYCDISLKRTNTGTCVSKCTESDLFKQTLKTLVLLFILKIKHSYSDIVFVTLLT